VPQWGEGRMYLAYWAGVARRSVPPTPESLEFSPKSN
jgi:hypothetical protein